MPNSNFAKLGDLGCGSNKICGVNRTPSVTERFFVGYALNGTLHDDGTRDGLPSVWPILGSPVIEPSPLNTRYQYLLQEPSIGTGIW